MTTPQGYSLAGYGAMITDRARMDAYAEALRRSVTPDSVVLDIGAGPGIMSLLACQYGARHVYAVEPDHSLHLARELAAANGCADRITFIQDISTAVELPEPATVIVSDLRGALPLFQQHIPSIVDARKRLLAPGGTLIPRRDLLRAAVAGDNPVRRTLFAPWQDTPYGLNLGPALDYAANSWSSGDVPDDALLTEGRVWAALDYRIISSPDVRAGVTLTVEREGEGCGLLLWFDAELIDGVCFSNAPPRPDSVYGQAFFPWPRPVALAAGDEINLALDARLTGDGYLWRWRSVLRRAGQELARFDQSSFFSMPLDGQRLKQREAGFVPALSRDGEIDRLILGLCDGRRTLGEIAEELGRAIPHHFSDGQGALGRVADVAARYAEKADSTGRREAAADFRS